MAASRAGIVATGARPFNRRYRVASARCQEVEVATRFRAPGGLFGVAAGAEEHVDAAGAPNRGATILIQIQAVETAVPTGTAASVGGTFT